MRHVRSTLFASTLMAAAASLATTPASALPLGPAAGGTALTSQIEQSVPMVHVRSRGAGVAAGIIGGMILGGILASRPYYYDYPPPHYYGPYPYDPAIAYCMRRFRSYDPYSMTYLGYDGRRHPCP